MADSTCSETMSGKSSERTCLYRDNILLFQEAPHLTEDVAFKMGRRFEALMEDGKHYFLIIDLTKARMRPSAAYRNALKIEFRKISPRIIHTALFVGSNIFLKIPAKIIAGGLFKSVSVHRDIEGALEAIKKKSTEANSN